MDVEKTIEFLLEHQARHEQALARHEAMIGSLAGLFRDLAVHMDERLDRLAEAQIRTEQRVQELAEGLKQTNDNLNALIRVVDDLVRRNGRHP